MVVNGLQEQWGGFDGWKGVNGVTLGDFNKLAVRKTRTSFVRNIWRAEYYSRAFLNIVPS